MAVASDIERVVASTAEVEFSTLADEELANVVIEGERLSNAINCFLALALDEFQRRRSWADEGALSAAGWVAARTGSSSRVLREQVRTGAGLRLLPAALPLARAGRLSPKHVSALGGAARRHPHLAARDEAMLVDQAQSLDADAFGVVVRHWEEHADAVESPDPTATTAPEPADELHVSRTFDGRYRLDGTFASETGQLIDAALDAHVDRQLRAARDGDPSVPLVASEVRAAALVDLAAQAMRREPSDASVPDRYRVAVVVQHDESEHLPLACCDSPAFRVVLGAKGEVLDVGRLTQAWPATIRRAITLRDKGCVFPGCDRPPSWCDIHHCQPWETGGRTSVDNGALFCRRHHTFIHKQRWTVAVKSGKPTTHEPDGSTFVIERWPSPPARQLEQDAQSAA